MGCRSEVKAKEAIISLTEEQKKQVDFIRLDLCDFQSIVSFVKQIKEKYPKIDILMNNAGAQPTKFNVTKDGFESFIQGNYLGMALLSNLLLKHFNENEGKIINVSSIAHFWSDLNESNYDVLLDNSIGLIKRQKVVGLEHQLCHRKTSPLTSAEHGHLLVYVLPLEKEGGKYIPEFQSDVSNCNPV